LNTTPENPLRVLVKVQVMSAPTLMTELAKLTTAPDTLA